MKKNEILFFSFGRLVYHLRSDEHQEYCRLIVERIEARVLAIGDAALTALWNTFKKYAIIEDFLYSRPKSAEETTVITELNGKRTNMLVYILDFIENVIKHSPHAADVEKAKHLNHVSEPYKKAPTKNIMGKTADIRNFVQDVLQEPNATCVTDLHLMPTFLELDAANKDLEASYMLRAELWLEKEKYGTLTQLRSLEDAAMQKVADRVKVLHLVNEETAKDSGVRAQLEAIAQAWNAVTEQSERTLSQRGVLVSLKKPSRV